MKQKPIPERLWANSLDAANGCREWTSSLNGAGYGRLCVSIVGKRKYVAAHRLSYLIFVGEIPDGAVVMHTCDNPLCIRPEHLRAGTHSDNARDAFDKGRRGKLSATALKSIQTGGQSDAELGRQFGVTRQCIRAARIGRNWSQSAHAETRRA